MACWHGRHSSLEERLLENSVDELLREQRAELMDVQFALDEARKRASAGTAEELEVRRLEVALADLCGRVNPEWLSGPATCIEHELARRRHSAEVQRLQAALAQARARFQHSSGAIGPSFAFSEVYPPNGMAAPMASSLPPRELFAWPPPSSPPQQPDPLLAWPRHPEVQPSDVVVERKRRFGDRLFRLWVEDCESRNGVRIHALDVASLSRMHMDLRDCEIQAMFDHFSNRRCDSMARWIARQAAPDPTDITHDRDLREFLRHLLDAAYFELAEGGHALQLRLPAFIDPPTAGATEESTLIEVSSPRSRGCAACVHPARDTDEAQSSPVTVRWIREKLLVPRSVATDGSAPSRSGASRASAYGRHPRAARSGSSATLQKAEPVYVASQRQHSAPRSGSISCRSCTAKATSRRSSSAHRKHRLSTSSWTSSSHIKDTVTVPSCSSRGSLLETSRRRDEVGRIRLHREGSTASVRSRPHSAREQRCHSTRDQGPHLAGAASLAVRSAAPPGFQCQAACLSRNLSQSAVVPPKRPDEAELTPYPPSQPRASGSGRPPPPGCKRTGEEVAPNIACSSSQLCMSSAPQASPRSRLLRPTSAKASKHKRVAECHEKPTVYEDYEPSVVDDDDGEELEHEMVPILGRISLSSPPRTPHCANSELSTTCDDSRFGGTITSTPPRPPPSASQREPSYNSRLGGVGPTVSWTKDVWHTGDCVSTMGSDLDYSNSVELERSQAGWERCELERSRSGCTFEEPRVSTPPRRISGRGISPHVPPFRR